MANIGIPTKLLHESLGHVISVELKTGQVYRGKLFDGESASGSLRSVEREKLERRERERVPGGVGRLLGGHQEGHRGEEGRYEVHAMSRT